MKKILNNKRKEYEPPLSINKWGWKYHHMGIPTSKQMPDERYIESLKMYVTGFDTSSYGIEWMRFEEDSPISELIKTVPHIAFEVDDIDEALQGKEVITEAYTISDGIKVAMIVDNGAPIELLEFGK